MIFITEEWEKDDQRFAGLLIDFDLTTFSETARYSIISESKGEIIGLVDTSGVAVDIDSGRVFISSDTDNSLLHVYELSNN